MCAPHPRYRIYTRFNSYGSFFFDLLLGRLNKGSDVTKLEKALVEQFGASHAVCIPMTRVGVYLTIKHLIKPGQGVIMSPYTIADIINMVILAGGIPVFVDVGQKTCNVDADKIEDLIDDNTGAVLITHLHGISAPATKIAEICQKHNLPLVEDVAQAFGAKESGKRLGTIGEAGVYSFGMYKNVNSWYGGAIVSKNKELIGNIRKELNEYGYPKWQFLLKRIIKGFTIDLSTHPLIFKLFTFWVFRYGFLHDIDLINKKVEIELDVALKEKMPKHYLTCFTPWQARLTLSQLKYVDKEADNRIKKAELYYQGLKDISELVMPPMDKESTYMYFPVQYQDRKKLLKFLMKHRRDVAAQHLKNCADLSSFSKYKRDCPIADKIANNVIILPTYPKYPIKEVKKNIKVIQGFFNKD